MPAPKPLSDPPISLRKLALEVEVGLLDLIDPRVLLLILLLLLLERSLRFSSL